MKNDARVALAVVGSGYMGLTYCDCIAHYAANCRLAGIAGGRGAASLAKRYNSRHMNSIEALIERPDVDGVILASPDFSRLELTKIAANAGKHVLSEKPMAPSVAECDEMISSCDNAGVILAVAHTQRFRDISRRTWALLNEGNIGQIRMIRTMSMYPMEVTNELFADHQWMSDERTGGFFLSMAVHNIDYIRWLTGREFTRVSANGFSYSGLSAAPLSIMAQMEMGGSTMAQLWITSEMPSPPLPDSDFSFQLIGSEGIVEVDTYRYLKIGTRKGWETLYEPEQFDYLNDPTSPVRLVPHARVVQDFVDSILYERQPEVGGSEGRAAVNAAQACIVSAKRGGLAVTL